MGQICDASDLTNLDGRQRRCEPSLAANGKKGNGFGGVRGFRVESRVFLDLQLHACTRRVRVADARVVAAVVGR